MNARLGAVFAAGLMLVPCRGIAADGVSLSPDRGQIARADLPNPAAAAEQLAQLVQGFVERDEIVGAELLVMQRGAPVLHRAFGWRDREAGRQMEPGTLFAIRSMTKPFTGMAAQLLVEEGRLELDAPVAKYLPSFDNERSRAVTIGQLLTHRSGFPLGHDLTKPLSAYAGGLREIADLAGARGPQHQPGERFVYSDVGSDVLGAVIAAVSGQSLEDFVRARILTPLGLDDTMPEAEAVTAAHADRVAARYVGMPGNWRQYWNANSAPLYPFLKGSGGLFSTTRDYARFLDAWMERDRDPAKALLSSDMLAQALEPASHDTMSTGFAGAVVDYGRMWMLYRNRRPPETVFAFGHGGSDGTHGYAFPESGLVVCYFTQTRGNETRARFEEALGHLFVRPDAGAMVRLLQPSEPGPLAEFTGLYAPGNRAANIAAIVELGGALVFEFPGRMILRLRATEERDRWVPERAPNDAIVFRRNEEGRITGLALHRGGRVDEATRFRPSADLPTLDELMSLREGAVPRAALTALLPLRVTAELQTQAGATPMTIVVGADGRSVTQVDLGNGSMMCTWIAGERVWRQTPAAPIVAEILGLERAEQLSGSLLVEMGDWREHYREVTVLARELFEGTEVFRVRLTPPDGIATTKLVNVETGDVVAEYNIVLATGGGPLGAEVRSSDFREIGGVRFAFAREVTFPSSPAARAQVLFKQIEPQASVDSALWDSFP